jgi:hypothetical protein
MAGPCPGGIATAERHAKCQNRDKCTGPGCRARRPQYVEPRDPEAGE